MKITRGRGRPRKAAQGRQEYPYTSPVQSRYATRSSRAKIATQLSAIPPSESKPYLRPALRILKEGQGTSEPELLHCSSKPPIGDDPVFQKSVLKDENPSISNGSPSISGPHEMVLDALCAKITSQFEESQEAALQQESHHADGDLQPPKENPMVLCVEPNIAKITTTDAPPTNQSLSQCHSNHVIDLDALCAKITSQVEEPQEAALQQESHQDADGDLQPPKENRLVQCNEPVIANITTTDAPPTNTSLSQCHSLNMTEFAIGLKDESDDDSEEIVSASRLGYEFVHGHEVRTEIAGLVRAIFGKYGNITRECKVKSPSIFSFLLERMCDVYQTLKSKTLYDLTLTDIKIMRDELQLCEGHKLNVAWLVKRLEQISEITSSSHEYLMLKEEAEKCLESKRKFENDLDKYRKHVSLIQKEITTVEQKIIEKGAKASRCTERAIEIRTRAKALGSQSLVHGLL